MYPIIVNYKSQNKSNIMNPPPPIPLANGRKTPKHNADAIAESIAFPPCSKIFLPTVEQRGESKCEF